MTLVTSFHHNFIIHFLFSSSITLLDHLFCESQSFPALRLWLRICIVYIQLSQFCGTTIYLMNCYNMLQNSKRSIVHQQRLNYRLYDHDGKNSRPQIHVSPPLSHLKRKENYSFLFIVSILKGSPNSICFSCSSLTYFS